jgi:hypothetical protein
VIAKHEDILGRFTKEVVGKVTSSLKVAPHGDCPVVFSGSLPDGGEVPEVASDYADVWLELFGESNGCIAGSVVFEVAVDVTDDDESFHLLVFLCGLPAV